MAGVPGAMGALSLPLGISPLGMERDAGSLRRPGVGDAIDSEGAALVLM